MIEEMFGGPAAGRHALDEDAVQTPIFHAATQNNDFGIDVVRLLLSRGADLTVRCQLPGHYERPKEVFMGTALDYARMFPGSANQTADLLTRST